MEPASLPSSLSKHLEETSLLLGVRRVVVACSGGGDSTALLLLLHSLSKTGSLSGSPPGSFDLVAAHIAHGLRGKAGDEDATFVARLTASLGIPFVLRSVDVPKNRRKGESLEAAGRRLRYEALLKLAEELGEGTRIATGHTRDDQAETVLLNLSRRSGRSRGGIRPERADGVVRPLLRFSRGELRTFLAAHGVAWREDETNQNRALLRNRIRQEILPELERRSPGTSGRLARAAAAWTARVDDLDRRIDAELKSEGVAVEGPWPRKLLQRLGREAAGRLLVRAAGRLGSVPGRKQVELVLVRLFRGDPSFAGSLAGRRFEAGARVARLLPSKKSSAGAP